MISKKLAFLHLVSFTILSCALPQPAHADPFGDFLKGIFGGGSQSSTAESTLRPRISSDPGKKTSALSGSKFYVVEVTCSKVQGYASQMISKGLIVDNQTFVANTLWLSGSSGDGGVPSNPVKIINAFSFEKEASGAIKDFDDQTCNDKFLISGKSNVLTVSLTFTNTKSMSQLSKVFSSALKITTGIVPLFLGGPLAANITGVAKAVGDTADPVKTIVEAFNDSPRKAVTAIRLRTGTTVVRTDYSRVTIRISAVTDIATQILTDDDLKSGFGAIFKSMSEAQLNGLAAAAARDRCAKFFFQLRDEYSFGQKDQVYLLGYFATKGFPGDVTSRLQCMLNRDLSVALLGYKFPYNADAFPPITQIDVDNVYPFGGSPLGAARLNSAVAQVYLERLSILLPRFAQADPGSSEKSKRALLAWIGADKVTLEDATASFSDDLTSSINADELVTKLAENWKRFGCFTLYPATSNELYDGIMLALPIKPASSDTFEPSELMGVRLQLAGSGKSEPPAKIQKIGLTRSSPPIAEAAKAFNGVCYTAKINIK